MGLKGLDGERRRLLASSHIYRTKNEMNANFTQCYSTRTHNYTLKQKRNSYQVILLGQLFFIAHD